MPMPPWSWIDCWPTNLPDLPICTLAAATAVARSLASSKSAAMVANIDMLRACSTATNMSAARCCSTWKLPIGTPNWVRVFKYSTVDFSDSSIAPTASAHIAIRASSTTRSISGRPPVLGRIAFFGDAPGVAGHQKYADAAGVTPAALGARGHYKRVRGLAVEHDEFLAIDHPAVGFFLGRGRDILQII